MSVYSTEKKSSDRFRVIKDKKNWEEAQNYCRENHTDLASGLNQLTDKELIREMESESELYWTGLFRDSWRWSDGSRVSFRHWVQDERRRNEKCAAAMLGNGGRWKTADCDLKKPFFCYDGDFFYFFFKIT